jgi:hypothetical protein
MAGFNLKGEQMWQQNFFDTHVSPTFAFAPAAGRFALGRTIVSGAFDPDIILPASVVSAQEVRVYQSYDGKLLVKIACSPVERAGQNFALSPDGLQLAVVRESTVRHAATRDYEAYTQHSTAVEVYDLPPLTAKDQAAVKEAETTAPTDTGARIDAALERLSAAAAATSPEGNSAVMASEGTDQTSPDGKLAIPASANDDSATTPARALSPVIEGDPDPDAPRKPPTLYGPDEKPEGNPSTQNTPTQNTPK